VLGAISIVGCGDRRPKRVVVRGEACTSPYDEKAQTRTVCPPKTQCLLMQSTPSGPSGRPYLCLQACKTDSDCSSLGHGYQCEHYDGHGDEYGCTRTRDGGT
jgi:hypothetical protein